jgi:iron complex outermembrane receptor protein
LSLLASLLSIAVILLRSGPAHANSLEELKNLSIAELLQVRIITASKVSEPLFKSTSDVTVFTSADIKRSGARSYHDLLMKVPGFIFNRTHSYAGAATVRGADATRILTLIDGHVLNEPEKGSAMNAFIDTLPVENIKRIEVIKGPGSALYGANAFLGIIHIITKDAGDIDGIEISAGTEFESDQFVGR